MRSDRTHRRTRGRTTAVTFTLVLVLALTGGLATNALAQVPATGELYGVHETVVQRAVPAGINPFRDLTLNATYHGPSGQVVNFWGFYDGNGAGGMIGSIWRIRFMPTQVGTWTVSWSFSDGGGSGSGSFSVNDTGIPGPAKLDPGNNKLLADARGNPIHWRGYGVKHEKSTDVPLDLNKAHAFVQNVIENGLVAGGFNAAYVLVPTGWQDGNCSLASMLVPPPNDQLDCGLWGDYNYYSLKASHFMDIVIKHLHQRRVWAFGWITFGLQNSPAAGDIEGRLFTNHQPLMRYFMARYGAYYNYFMWSTMWEVWETNDYVNRTNIMMSYLQSIDPWQRLQGVHDQAQVGWAGWQRILPRQQPSSNIFHGNNRTTGVFSGPTPLGVEYPFVIIGAEDLWEFCSGHLGKPKDGHEVRRGLAGALFANVLPVYDEWFKNEPGQPATEPCGGLGNGAGEGYFQGFLNWWYGTVNYRSPSFARLNNLTSGSAICSGIPGQEYVIYKQDGGVITLNLAGAPGTFAVTAINAVTGAQLFLGNIPGGGPVSAPSPFGAVDTLVFVKKL